MSGLLWWFASGISILLLLLSVVLLTPATVSFRLRSSPRWRLQISARAVGGLTPALTLHDGTRRRRRLDRPGPSRRRPASNARAVAAGPQLFRELLRSVRVVRLWVDADIGLHDPADTGLLFGALTTASYARPPGSVVSIVVRPDFTGPRVSGELSAELGFTPAALILPGMRFALRAFAPRP